MNRCVRVAVFDSGVGGLPYIQSLMSSRADLDLYYVADEAAFPYGTKTPSIIKDIMFERFRRMRARFDPDMIIITCTTAVQIALEDLRKAHPDIPVIGIRIPLKEAAACSIKGKIAVMTTARTSEDQYLDNIIARDAPEVEVLRIPAQDLVEFAERQLLFSSQDAAIAAVRPYLQYAWQSGVDTITLGCSHFVHLVPAMEQCCKLDGFSMQVIDSRQQLLAEINRQIEHEEKCGESGNCAFFLCGEPPADPLYSLWARRFSLRAPEWL